MYLKHINTEKCLLLPTKYVHKYEYKCKKNLEEAHKTGNSGYSREMRFWGRDWE